MTVISSIINDAFRESNITALAGVPSDNQNAEALRLYNSLLTGVLGTDAGEELSDWRLGNYGLDPRDPRWIFHHPGLFHPPINSRLVAVNDAAIDIALTEFPQDGARYALIDPYGRLAAYPVTLNGNGRTVGGEAAQTFNTNGEHVEFMFRADKGDWTQVSPVALTDENPFPEKFDQMFIILLAIRLNPRYGRELSDLSQSILRESRTAFVARYLNSRPLETLDDISWPFMSRQSYGYNRTFSSNRGFGLGRPYG